MYLLSSLILMHSLKGNLPILELSLAIILQGFMLLLADLERVFENHKLCKILSENHRLIGFFCFVILYLLVPNIYYFMPAIFFENNLRYESNRLIIVATFLLGFFYYAWVIVLIISLLLGLSNILYTSLIKNYEFKAHSFLEIDQLRQMNFKYKWQQDQLILLQNERENQSILEERRRITQEIHDLLGHQLSSSIIQIGALAYLEKDPKIKEKLALVGDTLNSSMNNVRSVIHAQEASSLDLEFEMGKICDTFEKCPLDFVYNLQTPLETHQSHTILKILKEALTNINKHSNASHVQVALRQINQDITFLIADNGTSTRNYNIQQAGIGLLTIEERVQQLKGKIAIHHQNGFRIFITFPIQQEKEQ